MLKNILSQIVSVLEESGVNKVYTAFDNLPLESKGRDIITVVSVDSFESSAPLYSEYNIFLPFKAEIGISLVAPLSMSMAQLYDYFDSNILPLMDKLGSLTCNMRNLTMKNDANLHKLVLKLRFSATGISKLERSSS